MEKRVILQLFSRSTQPQNVTQNNGGAPFDVLYVNDRKRVTRLVIIAK